MQKTNKVLWHRACVAHKGTWRPLEGSEGRGRLLERVLEAWAGEWARRVSVLQRISLRERERKTWGRKLWWSKGVLFNIVWVFILSYKIAIFSRDKIKTYKETWGHPYEGERVVNNHFYHMVHKKEEGTYHHIEKLTKEMPGFLSPQERLASALNSWIFRN